MACLALAYVSGQPIDTTVMPAQLAIGKFGAGRLEPPPREL
ncbi:MAG: hypothetical protein ACR2RV_28470 [Verrucomicrobiales bacterium]